MELNSQINTFTNGMNLDTDLTIIPTDQYRYAENIRLLTDDSGTTGILQNIDYVKQYTGQIPEDEIVLGTATTRLYDEITKGTIECGIVFTKKTIETVDGETYTLNKLYKLTGFNSTTITVTAIIVGRLNIENNVSIVTNYESDYVSNVYICDGLTPIKVINICDEHPTDEILDPTRYDITPGCVLLPFTFINTINGSLPAGSVQYCYQLFNQNGPETTTSALSEVIPITKYDSAGESRRIQGQMKGELSSRGCKIKANFKNDGRFDRARIFSIIYLDNVSIPDIYIVNEIKIPKLTSDEFISFEYEDTGASFLSKITIDEFNAMVPFEFNAKSIEKMQNRLFASNIEELTWDVEFDARAYRCANDGSIVLQHSNTSQTISGVLQTDGTIVSAGSVISVPEEHDCINPSNTDVLNSMVYAYGTKFDTNGNRIRGGTGPNVSYRFVYTQLVASGETVSMGQMANSLTLNTSAGSVNSITTLYDDKYTVARINNLPTNSVTRAYIPNYSDPYICTHFLGYQRDEIYRFGIIFYNNKNIPSPVHWIGDIRMPSIKDAGSDTDNPLYPFHKGDYSFSYGTFKEIVSYALGIEFTINNVPDNVSSYEIVRCDRTEKDRTVVTQGIMGGLIAFTDWDQGEYNFGSNDLRPSPTINLANKWSTLYRDGSEDDWDDQHKVALGYVEFISPEICISKDTILQKIQGNVLTPLYKANSAYGNSSTIRQNSVYTTAYKYISTGIFNIPSGETSNSDVDFGKEIFKDGVCYFDSGNGKKKPFDGFAGVFKYYNFEYDSSIITTLQIEDGIISQTLPIRMTFEIARGYGQPIGSKTYVNTTVCGQRRYGNHGISAVLKIPESFNPYKTPTTIKDYCTGIVSNVKQSVIPYGGNTYISRQNSIYTSCGCINNDFTQDVICYGGDTYLCILDYLNTSMVQPENDPNKNLWNNMCCIDYIPLETVINLNLRSDNCYHRSASSTIGPNLVQSEPVVLANGYTQDKPYYEYNPAYSSTSGGKQYVGKSIYSVDNQINQTRIVVSELKTNNELINQWTKFKFANYLDVDSQYGEITNIKAFNNKLFFWQNTAVGIATVNERSLIVDNNIAELTLGTGGILTRFDYVATLNGSSIINDKSITTSSTTIYWYDFDKNEICALGNGVTPLSKTKSTQSYLNSLSRSERGNAVSFYDKKFNEVWFRIYDKSLIYNEQLQAFTSFYTHNPNWFFPFSDKLVTIKDNKMYYLYNIYEMDDSSQPKEERISKIEFIVNKDISNTKVFDNVVFSAKLKTDNDSDLPIIKDILFKTKTQETAPLTIEDIDLREDNYRFAIPRQMVIDEEEHKQISQSYLGRMRGKYLICDYTFDCNNNREFKLPYIKTTYRYSML